MFVKKSVKRFERQKQNIDIEHMASRKAKITSFLNHLVAYPLKREQNLGISYENCSREVRNIQQIPTPFAEWQPWYSLINYHSRSML